MALQNFDDCGSAVAGPGQFLRLLELCSGFRRRIARDDGLLHQTRKVLFRQNLAFRIEDAVQRLPLLDLAFRLAELQTHVL